MVGVVSVGYGNHETRTGSWREDGMGSLDCVGSVPGAVDAGVQGNASFRFVALGSDVACPCCTSGVAAGVRWQTGVIAGVGVTDGGDVAHSRILGGQLPVTWRGGWPFGDRWRWRGRSGTVWGRWVTASGDVAFP